MTAKELFQAGRLGEAVETQFREVRAKPTDMAARTFLFELLCFQGELDRAEKQLDVIGQQHADSEWGAQVYRNVLAAERTRRRLFAAGVKPEFLLDPPAYLQWHLDAVNRLREGNATDAASLLARSRESRPAVSGEVDGQPVEEFCDCDDLFAPLLEFIILRDYVWIPWEQIREIEISAPERPRDLLWIPTRLTLADDSRRSGYAPTHYPGTYQHPSDQVKLGRMTDWKSTEDGPVLGVGLRQYLVGDDAKSILDIRHAAFQPPQ